MRRFMKPYGAYYVLYAMLLTSHIRGQAGQDHQAQTVAHRSAVLAVSVALKQDAVSAGTASMAYVTVTNLTDSVIIFPSEMQLRVEGSQGELDTTLLQRQMTHNLHAGEHERSGSDLEPDIPARGSLTKRVELSELYTLTVPGTYALVVKVMDQSNPQRGIWVRSDPITFTVRSPS